MAARNSNLRLEISDLRVEYSVSWPERSARGFQVSNLQSPISHPRPVARRQGVTLLELILALSLSVILLFAVGMSLRLYWRSFDVKRTNVEQAHLARAVLRKMEDDLRSAIQYTPVDLSGLESMASASSLAGAMAGITSPGTPGATPSGGAGGGATGGSGATGGGSTGGSPMGGTSGGSATQTPTGQSGQGASGAASSSGATKSGSQTTGGTSGATSAAGSTGSTPSSGGTSVAGQTATGEPAAAEATEEAPPPVIGLYGSSYQIQFDVSRLPRVDEYGSGSPTSMVQIPSDIKTVTYYVRSETTEGSGTISTFGSGSSSSTPAPGSSEPSTTGQGRGLMRLEMDRAVSAFGQTGGTASSGYDGAKLLASEVTSVAFRYWDGMDWVSDWNSDEMGGLPLAVEIVMTMADANSATTPTAPPVQNFGSSATTSTEPSYRIVVSLPTASLPPPVEEPAETEATTTTPATGAAGGTSSGSTKGTGGATSSGGATGNSGSSTSGKSSGSSSTYGTGSKTGGS